MEAKRNLIIELHNKGQRNCDILRAVSGMGISKQLIQRTVRRFINTKEAQPRKKSYIKRTVRTPEVIKLVRERLRRNPSQSTRIMAKHIGISQSSINRITRFDLRLKAYKKQKVHGLTTANKIARVQRCKHLLAWHGDSEILFSDEKMFLLQDAHYQQNDRVYSVSLADAPKDKLAIERFQNVSRVMVWGAISKRGKLPLHFVEPGVKVNQDYYIEEVLKKNLVPNAQTLYGEDYYCFQQDSAPAHKAKRTIEYLEKNIPDFIEPTEWPASSPDLNPLDYFAWGYMLGKLSNVKRLNLQQFKKLLVKIWDEMPQDIVRAACESFPKRMRHLIKEGGERFELN